MANPQPHVVMLPFPAQGHIKPMLMLAEALCHAEFRISFVNTDHIHNIIVENIDKSPLSQFLGFRFLSIPDGLPPEHPRDGSSIKDLFTSINSTGKIMFRDLIISLLRRDDLEREEIWQAPCCIIADGIMSTLAIDVEEELEMPVITFRTYSATCTWVYFHLEKLIEQKEIPVREGDEDIDRLVTCIPELENVLRRRDLPSICRCEVDPSVLKFFLEQTSKMRRASGLILNTFEDLEAPIIRQLHSIYSKVYTIGPLQALLKSQMDDSLVAGAATSSLRQEDRTCIAWLDKQPAKSVVYVSFGSVVVISRDQILEFWHGLINSGKPFLWVIRPDLVFGNGPNGLPEEIMCLTNERGYVVSWAPQEEVLAHCAVGGFLTHSGWNSTLESITVGLPMICWPLIADQKVNSRCVSDIWRVGIDMKDSCDRSTVERMVRVLMEDKDEEIAKSTSKFANLAQKSVREGGSSFCSMNKLIEDLRSIQSKKDDCKTSK